MDLIGIVNQLGRDSCSTLVLKLGGAAPFDPQLVCEAFNCRAVVSSKVVRDIQVITLQV